jgi:hypothetical protein
MSRMPTGAITHCYYEEGDYVENRWIRARGFSSRQSYKRSFTLKTDDDDDSEDKYALNACYADESCMRNRLAFETYQDLDIPAPENEPTALFLNDEYIGYYDMVPIYDGEDLMDYYDADDLELYKCHFCEYEGNDSFGEEHPLQSLSEKKYPDDDDYETLNSMIIKYLELDDDEWNEWVGENFDVEATARYCAAHKLLQVGDTAYFNYYIVVIDGLYTLLPWDNEQCLYDDFNESELSRLQKRLLQDGSPVLERYEVIMTELITEGYYIEGTSVAEELMNRVYEYHDEIDRAVYYDNYRNYDYDDFLDSESYLIDNIETRITYIENNF